MNITDSLQSKNIAVCAITETWLATGDDPVLNEYYELGYKVVHKPRSSGKGGGVGFLIRKGLDAKVIRSCSFNSLN